MGEAVGAPRTLLRIAATAASFCCVAIAVGADPELDEHIGNGVVLLVLAGLGGLVAWRNVRSKQNSDPVRSRRRDFVRVLRDLRPAFVLMLLAVPAGMLLHPLIETSDDTMTVAFGVVGLFLAGVADEVKKVGTRPGDLVIRPLALVVVIVLAIGAWSLFWMAVGWARLAGLIALALVLIALLVAERRDRRRAEFVTESAGDPVA